VKGAHTFEVDTAVAGYCYNSLVRTLCLFVFARTRSEVVKLKLDPRRGGGTKKVTSRRESLRQKLGLTRAYPADRVAESETVETCAGDTLL
jgi:hypothetical protein